MRHLKCGACHHEWGGNANDACSWCGFGASIDLGDAYNAVGSQLHPRGFLRKKETAVLFRGTIHTKTLQAPPLDPWEKDQRQRSLEHAFFDDESDV